MRSVLAGVAALLTGLAMGGTRLLARGGPPSHHPAIVGRWYTQHVSALGWRALLVAIAAVGTVAFAASFRERTWTVVPDRLWTGTVMVLAALGYAALTSVASAVEFAVVWNLRASSAVPDAVVAFASSVDHALVGVATPAIVVVLLGTTLPFNRWSIGGQFVAVAAVITTLLLSNPLTWRVGRDVLPVWFAMAALVLLWPHRDARGASESRRRRPPDDGDVPASLP